MIPYARLFIPLDFSHLQGTLIYRDMLEKSMNRAVVYPAMYDRHAMALIRPDCRVCCIFDWSILVGSDVVGSDFTGITMPDHPFISVTMFSTLFSL